MDSNDRERAAPEPIESDARSPSNPRRTSTPPPHLAQLAPPARGLIANLRYDLPSSLVVFLVALPLCLGIAVASNAPPLAGLVAGIVGGVLVAWISGSQVAVSGPAAGLTVIVAGAIAQLGYEGLLLATVAAGAMQVAFGLLRAGVFAYYFPSGVIKGMLAAIGLILILKQIPHALGFDADFEGDETLLRQGELGPLEQIEYALEHVHFGALITSLLGLAVLIGMGRSAFCNKLTWLPAPLVVVGLGVALNALFTQVAPAFVMGSDHLVRLPTGGPAELMRELSLPSFERWADPAVYQVAITLAIVASLETLLCIEAMDKLDLYKRSTPTNRELVAQGVGNVVSGMLGGLPMTAVIVRGSANIQAGGRTRNSSFLHGIWLLLAVLVLPFAINLVPLAALAAILLHVGYKLAPVGLFRAMFRRPFEQWAPFAVTVLAILLTDLLKGVGIGMLVGVGFILHRNLKVAYFIHRREAHASDGSSNIRIELSENVSFLNKASVSKVLHELPPNASVTIDGTRSIYIHPDVLELIHEFEQTAHTRQIEVELVGIAEPEPLPGH